MSEIARQGRLTRLIGITTGTWVSDDKNDPDQCANVIIVAAGTIITSIKYKNSNGFSNTIASEGEEFTLSSGQLINVESPVELVIGERSPGGARWVITEIATIGGGAAIYGY